MSDSLTPSQRERLVTDITDYREIRIKSLETEYCASEKQSDIDYLEALSDEDLVSFWKGLVGEIITDNVHSDTDTELGAAWENADVNGVVTPVEWQLQKLLDGDDTDYMIPTILNLVSKVVDEGAAVTFEHGSLEFMLNCVDINVDEEGYLIDAETGEYKQPYTYNRNSNLRTAFEPVSEFANIHLDIDETHRIHKSEFGGLIDKAVFDDGSDQILYNNEKRMIELFQRGLLTRDMAECGYKNPVMTTNGIYKSYKIDAEIRPD